jgi:hypothetical protein
MSEARKPEVRYNRAVRWTFGLVVIAACGRVGFDPTAARDGGSSSEASADAVLDAGLIGWWKLDDGSGTVAADSSGHGDNGTLTAGVTWVTSSRGVAISIDGGADHDIDLGDVPLLEPTGSMTLAAWVNPTVVTTTSRDNVIVSRDDAGNGMSGWSLKAGTTDCGDVRFSLQIAERSAVNTLAERCSNTAPMTSTWFHVAGVYDSAVPALDVYIDGVVDDGPLTANVPTAQYEPTSSVHVEIGNADPFPAEMTGGQNVFDGLMQDVRMYDRALTPAEIAALAQ